MKYIIFLLLTINIYALEVGTTINSTYGSKTCIYSILYNTSGHGFGVLYNPKTDKPYHCETVKVISATFTKPANVIIKITK